MVRRFAAFIGVAAVFAAVIHAQPAVLTWHNDNSRTGQNQQETILTTANVKSSTFGRLAVLNVDGKVDAQPLYVPSLAIPSKGIHNVLYIATEHDSVYAFDADTFEQLVNIQLLGPTETTSDDHGCGQVSPEIGITATPAIDLSAGPHGTIYVITMSKDGATYHQRLHALDLTTLAEQFNGPIEITASFPGNGAENTFVPGVHKERAALLIQEGIVYTSWSSHCDAPPYAGWVLSYDEKTLAQVGVLNLTPNGNDGAIWAAGSGPAADSDGNVYVILGNGTFDTTLDASGFPSKRDFGNAFVKISTAGPLSAIDYFTMSGTVSESALDVDLGSGGLMLLPPLNTSQGLPVSLVVGAGKDGAIYVLDKTDMGKFSPDTDSIYQFMPDALHGGTWSSPAWFNGNLYYGAPDNNLKTFAFKNGYFALSANSSASFGYPGTTPSISSNGTTNGIVWAVENSSTAVLHAYDATNVGVELYNSNQALENRDHFGSAIKFAVPTIVNGKVYVGTASSVAVFGLLTAPATPSLSITKTHIGDFAQGQLGASYTLTVSNVVGSAHTSGAVTVTENIPAGLLLASLSGSGWTCSDNTCSRSDALAAGLSYPPVIATVNVAANAPSSLTNSASVSGGGDSGGVKTATDPTRINPEMFTLTTSVSPAGAGTVTPASGSTFANGAAVNLQATAGPGYSFGSWTGSVASQASAATTVTMNSSQTVTANFTAGPTTLGGANTAKSGPSNARQWDFDITNNGPGAASAISMDTFVLTQAGGTACTPVVLSPSFPHNLGNLAPSASVPVTVTIDFSACPVGARFTLQVGLSANGGTTSGSFLRYNQFQ